MNIENMFCLELTTKTTTVECQLADMADRISSVRTPQFVMNRTFEQE